MLLATAQRDFLKHLDGDYIDANGVLNFGQLRRFAVDLKRLRQAQSVQYTEFEFNRVIAEWLLHHAPILSRSELKAMALSEVAAEAPLARTTDNANEVAGAYLQMPSGKGSFIASNNNSSSASHSLNGSSKVSRRPSDAGEVLSRTTSSSANASLRRKGGAASLSHTSAKAEPQAPSRCERCGKRTPDRRVQVGDASLATCGKVSAGRARSRRLLIRLKTHRSATTRSKR